MPVVCTFYGIVITMLFNEHNPPHFHVKYGDYRALVTINDGIVEGKLPRRALNMVFEWLDLHRQELLENWERMTQNKSYQPIEPLQ